MDWLPVMRERHSVRQYTDRPIPQAVREELSKEIEVLNGESGLHMQLFFDEPECFGSLMSRRGNFVGVRNYLAIVGPKSDDLDERAGYYGEKIVMLAQSLGLNSCWVGLTHGRSHAKVGAGEKQVILVSLGYGVTQGVPHQGKRPEDLCHITASAEGYAVRSAAGATVSGSGRSSASDVRPVALVDAPDWFRWGMAAAALSPTAVNQQKFLISYDGRHLTARVDGHGFFSKVDLGIVKCDFELASGRHFDQPEVSEQDSQLDQLDQ